MHILLDGGLLLLAYLLGSLSAGLVLTWLRDGPDPRHGGSGNIGATNVARTSGKVAGLLTLLGDICKGLLAVLLALWWGHSALLPAGVALAAVLGHMFPLYYGFRGGKGVATALGVFLPLLPLPLLGGCMVWGIVVVIWHYVSAGSMLAAVIVPLLAALLAYPPPSTYAAGIIGLLILYKHRANMQRLLQGTEHRL
jgi:glycerol-3-phosphate acyltransferase PlsY